MSFEEEAAVGKKRVDSPTPGLSHREIEVLFWLANGKTDHEIARLLALSGKTVNHHVEHIMAKLNANNRAHAVAIAMRLRLVPFE